MKLHEKIKALRKEREISQEMLAEQAQINISYLSRLENGHNEPSVEVFKRIADALGVSADYLLDESDEITEVRLEDKALSERVRMIDSLDEADRQAVFQVIDAMLTKKRMKELINKQPIAS
jgi:transcriptional regulator with XRE-family HTH domain